MNIRRTIPPAAAPISSIDLAYGFYGIVNKKLIAKLESEIIEYFGTKYAFMVSSGKAALFLIVTGLKRLSNKRKVIIPAYTCFSVPSAIRMAGLEIVLCDIKPETLDYDLSQLRNLVDDDTLCIISTHLFGIPSDVAKIQDLCGNRKIFIVEDAAQAMGAISGNRKLGTLGDVAFFSLGRGKNITCGSGGIIITSEDRIADSIRGYHGGLGTVPLTEYIKNIVETILLNIFLFPSLYWLPKSLPFLKIGETKFYRKFPVHQLTGFQAGLLFNWRNKLETYNRNRSDNADYYLEKLSLIGRMPIRTNGNIYNRFPIFLDNKALKDKLCESGNSLGISPMYPSSIDKIQEIKEDYMKNNYSYSETIADTLVALPTHSLLTDKDKDRICEMIENIIEHEHRQEQAMPTKVKFH